MGQALLKVEGLRKSFGTQPAVAGVSFEVEAGEIFGLLGPNGAGKTTTLSCVCGLLQPDAGTVRIGTGEGGNPTEARRRLGVVPQELALYDELTVEENLDSFGGLFDIPRPTLRDRVGWCLQFAQLEDRRRRKVAELSGGMKRRLNLAIALIHDPVLVLADEPTVGVDPQSRNHLFNSIESLAGAGKGVVYTTHYMEEVEHLCQRAAIIDHGQVVAGGTVGNLLLLAQDTHRVRFSWTGGMPARELCDEIGRKFGAQAVTVEGADLNLSFAGEVPITALVTYLADQGRPVSAVSMQRPTLEDAFLKLTGRRLRDT